MHGGGIAIGDLLVLLLMLWLLMLLWLLYPIFHYTVSRYAERFTHDRSCACGMCITLVPYLKRLLDMNLDEKKCKGKVGILFCRIDSALINNSQPASRPASHTYGSSPLMYYACLPPQAQPSPARTIPMASAS